MQKVLRIVAAACLLAGAMVAEGSIVDVTTFCGSCDTGTRHGVINVGPIYYEVAQTFSVVNSGTLTGIDVRGTAQTEEFAGILDAFIVPVQNGAPLTDLSLALGAISLSNVEWASSPYLISFSGFSVPVLSGDTLAVVFAAGLKPGGTAFSLDFSPVSYSFGSALVRTTGDIGVPPMSWASRGDDLMFRTHIQCSGAPCASAPDWPFQVPEPGTSVLFGLALLSLGLMRRPAGLARI